MKTHLLSRKPSYILSFIVCLFFIKGLFFGLLMPWFQNPDEQIHYGTVQNWAYPQSPEQLVQPAKSLPVNERDVRTYDLPEEMGQTAFLVGFDAIKFEKQNTQNFSDTDSETTILTNDWGRFITSTASAVSSTTSVYYLMAGQIEYWLQESDIFTRLFFIRILSLVFGIGVVLLTYSIARKVLSHSAAILTTVLVSFQPMLAVTAAQINIDIALVFSFSLFLLAGISLLKSTLTGPKRPPAKLLLSYGTLTTLVTILGFYSKGPGIVLVVALFPLFAYLIQQYFSFNLKKYLISLTIISLFGLGSAVATFPDYFASITATNDTSIFSSPVASLSKYLSKTIDVDEFRETALSYWGNFGWLDTRIGENILQIIWFIEFASLIGLLLFFIPWSKLPFKINEKIPSKIREFLARERDFLPSKKYILFFVLMIIALQFATRFYDWRVFDIYGKQLIGTPGRYFLPNVIGHIILLVTGLGYFCRTKSQFIWLLKTLVIALILLNSYIFLDVIIPRYYL